MVFCKIASYEIVKESKQTLLTRKKKLNYKGSLEGEKSQEENLN